MNVIKPVWEYSSIMRARFLEKELQDFFTFFHFFKIDFQSDKILFDPDCYWL